MESLFVSFFWFLLPIAALSGWYVGGRSKKHQQNDMWVPTPKYVESLNKLLNQTTNKAIESLISLFEVNPATVYTHIILGNLFRERGELEKATRLHQNIVSQGHKIGKEETIIATLELGRDYLFAGLLDSAEKTFSEIIKCDSRSATRTAHKSLVDIYEREKHWEKAIQSATYLKNEGDLEYELRIVHYHNEIAEKYLNDSEYKKAKSEIALAKKLLKSDNCRTVLLSADIEFAQGNKSTALHLYSTILSTWGMYAQLVLPKLKDCFPTDDQFVDYLHNLKPNIITVSYIVTYMQALLDAGRIDEAEEFVSEMIDKKYAPIGMLKLFIEYHLPNSSDSKFISHITNALKLHEDTEGFICSDCGLKLTHLYWHCPSCHAWGKIESLDVIRIDKTQ